MKIKNIVFDLGGVIVDLDIAPALKTFARTGLMPANASLEQISKQGFPKDWPLSGLIHRMDCGELDTPTFFSILRQQCGTQASDEQLSEAFNSIIKMRKNRLEWLVKLREHYRLFLLSNVSDLHWKETCRQAAEFGIPMEQCFDRMFLSYRLRMTKPDPRIYELMIRETGIDPAETLYIDDLPDNIEAGRKAGLQGHKITSNALEADFPQTLNPKLIPEIL